MKRSLPMSLLAAVAIAIASLFSAPTASAQPVVWSCPTTDLINLTGCDINIDFFTDPPGAIGVNFLPPCQNLFGIPTGGVMRILGVRSQGGAFAGIMKPAPQIPAIPAPCGPVPIPSNFPSGWIRGVILGPSGCCVSIYFFDATNSPACTIYIVPAPPGTPCIP